MVDSCFHKAWSNWTLKSRLSDEEIDRERIWGSNMNVGIMEKK